MNMNSYKKICRKSFLNEAISKKNIDKELVEKQKNPFFMLSTDVKAISIHSRKEVPGSMQFTNEK